METLKEAVLDAVLALLLFTVAAGSRLTPRACHDDRTQAPARSARSSP